MPKSPFLGSGIALFVWGESRLLLKGETLLNLSIFVAGLALVGWYLVLEMRRPPRKPLAQQYTPPG